MAEPHSVKKFKPDGPGKGGKGSAKTCKACLEATGLRVLMAGGHKKICTHMSKVAKAKEAEAAAAAWGA